MIFVRYKRKSERKCDRYDRDLRGGWGERSERGEWDEDSEGSEDKNRGEGVRIASKDKDRGRGSE